MRFVERSGLPEIIQGLAARPEVTVHHVRPGCEAVFGELPGNLDPRITLALRRLGIERPYTHQARALALLRAGRDVVLTTPTASGKTLCYNVPVLERLLQEPEARALYLFPTKALSQDQYAGLHRLIEATGESIGTFTFDGDTHPDARRAVRDQGRIVITNPDMLHAGILPQHTRWLKLFENLRYVVIDELHTYRGVFGSHVANLLRRLRRVAAFHGTRPQFVCCSATIANPRELARGLTGLDHELVDESGAPRGEHHVVAYNPPVVNPELQIRAGVVREGSRLAARLLTSGISTIVFAGSRLHVEVMLKYIREALERAHQDPETVQGYRGGYLPSHRRRIEAGLRNGTVRGVVATNALELGIDIGSLDACLIAGYPGSIASLWQQSGRAGRRSGPALTVFMARSSAVDQYLVTHPEVLLGASVEHARIDPQNLFVLADHMKCAAFELPFEEAEAFGDLTTEETEEVLGYLASHGVLHASGGRYHWMERVYPAHHVPLRGPDEENFVVVDVAHDRVLAEVDFRSAHTTIHPHAIYHLDADQYQVERLDYENHKAYVRRVEPDYYTTAMTLTRISVLEKDDARAPGPGGRLELALGEVLVTHKVVGFKKLRFHTHENVGYGEVHLPDQELHTSAFWLRVPDPILKALGVDRAEAIDALRGLCHALHVAATVGLMCAGHDLGSVVEEEVEAREEGRFDPTLYLYDAIPGGVGLSGDIYKRFPEILQRAEDLLAGCGCAARGCPSCLGPLGRYDGAAQQATRNLARVLASELAG
jgi:DEAD/DEAH box helicase domain-containing protein